MATLTVTSRGQVTFRKELLQHLGIEPGGKLHVELLPDGRAQLRGDKPTGTIADLRGLLRGKTDGRRHSLDEINDAIAEAGARAGMGDR